MGTSAPLNISLPNIQQGAFMTWTLSTQAANNVCATLSDSVTTYANGCRQSSQFGVFAQGFSQVVGNNLKLRVTATSSGGTPNLVPAMEAFALANPLTGQNVAFGYNIAVEDSTDADFNDLYVTVVAWFSQG